MQSITQYAINIYKITKRPLHIQTELSENHNCYSQKTDSIYKWWVQSININKTIALYNNILHNHCIDTK